MSLLWNFNSIKVRLKRKMKSKNYVSLIFQFHKGTIKTGEGTCKVERSVHFNSIKVRLKHDSDFAEQVLAHLFQFHKGTIKTIIIYFYTYSRQKFQFHKGTIKTR